jgi:hypothetical protein
MFMLPQCKKCGDGEGENEGGDGEIQYYRLLNYCCFFVSVSLVLCDGIPVTGNLRLF